MTSTTGKMSPTLQSYGDGALLEACRISKSFPGVQALSEVDFDLRPGEVHALVGENGAGKSTLTRIIAGLEQPDAGQMLLYRQPYQPQSRADAEAHGIRMVMQELHLIGNLTVAENIFIEKLPNTFGVINYGNLNAAAREIMQQVGLGDVDPAAPVRSLGIGQQQMVEIAAGLSQRCRILALDEPTASLTDKEIELLFAQIGKLKAAGVGIIYISHRIEEVMHIGDRVTVLRDGKVIGTRATSELGIDEIIRMMVGRDLDRRGLRHRGKVGDVALAVVGLSLGDKVKHITFQVHRGEILGFAGLVGSGRTETMRALFGADRPEAGQIYLQGSSRPARITRPSDAVRNGIAFLTEDRKEQGLLLPLSVRVNISLTRLLDVSRLGWINTSRERAVADEYGTALSVRYSSVDQPCNQLSGGNQQKVVIAKWIYKNSDILIFDEPTRGIDVGAKFEIYRLLAELAEKGKAIILVSSDLKELMAVCDRIAVMSAGRLVATFSPGQWSEEKIIAAAFSQYVGVARAETCG
jgi:ribose transport system ATP-binding protein